jgi:carbon-monoxide dehydrogenase small subunit
MTDAANFLEGHRALLTALDEKASVPLQSIRELLSVGSMLLVPDTDIRYRRQVRRALDFWTAYLRARELSGEADGPGTEQSTTAGERAVTLLTRIAKSAAGKIGAKRHPRYRISLLVNGARCVVEVEARTLLVELLREHLGLTGTHVGCDTALCGACVVIVDGVSVKSCCLLAVQADGTSVETIEGLADEGGNLHPVQEAFRASHALQCGFCTPGMIMSSIDLLRGNPNPSEAEVRTALEGNLCRCVGYHKIVRAVTYAAHLMQDRASRRSAA